MEYAQIITYCTTIARNRYEYRYEWQGNPHALAKVHTCLPEFDLRKLPWPTKVVRTDGMADQLLIIARTDGFNLVSFWYWLLRTRLGWLVTRVYHRLILTAMVWGLGFTPEYLVPSWRDLYAAKWLVNKLEELQNAIEKRKKERVSKHSRIAQGQDVRAHESEARQGES